jgi:hypothetical protein
MQTALSGIDTAIRPGKTIGIIENGKVVEYIWPTGGDVSGAPPKKTADVDISGKANKDGGNNLTGDQFTAGAFNSTMRTADANTPQNVPGNTLFAGGNFNAHVSNSDYLNYGSRPTFGFTIDGLYGAAIYLRSNVEKSPLWLEIKDINGITDKLALMGDVTTANANKRDKLETFYTTQTASFNVAADMVDKIVRCNHATVAITATIADDSLFAIGARFEVRQSGVAGVTLAAPASITLNAPQGLVLSRRYSYMQVVKQAANVYSVTIIGDDPTKVDKVVNKGLSTNDYTDADKAKVAAFVEHFKGKYTALANAPATGNEGDYLYIDAGASSDALEYIWDSSDNKWTPSTKVGASSFGQLTGVPTDNASLAAALGAKLNTGANTGLAGTGSGVAVVMPDGTVVRNPYFKFDPTALTVTLGDATHLGNLVVASNEFKLKVQENITSGNASIEFNDNQAKALVFRSTDSKEYIALRSTDNDEAVIFLQKFVVDQGIFAALNTLQMQASSAVANTKVYFNDSMNNNVQVPFATDNITVRFSGNFMAHNNSGSIGNIVMSGTWVTVLKRIAGVISVVYFKTTVEADSGVYTPEVSAESLDNNTIKFYCKCTNATGMDWKIGKVEYYSF